MRRFVLHLLSILLMYISSNASAENKFNRLASSGRIEEGAAIKASVQMTIDAPPEKVWALLTCIDAWPKWHHDVSHTEISGTMTIGTPFTWTTSGTQIYSSIELLQPLAAFGWTGTAYGTHAIHLWRLQRVSANQTLVKVDESMSGLLLSLFFSRKKLEEADRQWLADLKTAAEK